MDSADFIQFVEQLPNTDVADFLMADFDIEAILKKCPRLRLCLRIAESTGKGAATLGFVLGVELGRFYSEQKQKQPSKQYLVC